MTLTELRAAILDLLPNSTLSTDNDGQLVIYTALRLGKVSPATVSNLSISLGDAEVIPHAE